MKFFSHHNAISHFLQIKFYLFVVLKKVVYLQVLKTSDEKAYNK